jgi:effector-binding domain-containing protein
MEHVKEKRGKKQPWSAPQVTYRQEQPYAGIRTLVTMREMGNAIPQLLQEVYAWLGKHGIAPAGAPFTRFHVIDMAGKMDIEMGVPLPGPIQEDDRVKAGMLPAGNYATLVYTGVRNGIKSNAALLDWIAKQGLVMDRWDEPTGDAFCARYESYLTDPQNEPKMAKWETEVAIKLK